MIEIGDIHPLFLCNKSSPGCGSGECFEGCKHTTCELFAKNKDAIRIFNEFCDTFRCIVDDNGNLQIWEKE